jgi:hypothetical protein
MRAHQLALHSQVLRYARLQQRTAVDDVRHTVLRQLIQRRRRGQATDGDALVAEPAQRRDA